MLMGFKTAFKEQVLSGKKIHSIRALNCKGRERWREGMAIQMGTEVRTRKYSKFKEAKALRVRPISILEDNGFGAVYLKGHRLSDEALARLAENDGFGSVELFFRFFLNSQTRVFSGQLIEWELVTPDYI